MASIATRIGPADHGRVMSLDEFLEADVEPGYRYELARGVVEVTNVPNEPHGLVEWIILGAIVRYGDAHPGLIFRAGGGASVRFWLPGMVSGRNPDVAVVLRNSPKDHRGRRIASLAMEIVSEGSEVRDYETKRQEYLAYGLLEYWIVDPLARRVTVLTRRGDVWAERIFNDDQLAEGLVLPGFQVHVADLWAGNEEASED
jgi:Uma2 family endonuclease